eukprot:m.91520 g.91520  ORF g.91520 m.91520 type:complete len:351 (+) comp8604_c0_seq1:3-1055(+)
MTRQITIILPPNSDDVVAELEATLRNHIHVHHLVRIRADDGQTVLRFQCTTRRAREILEVLHHERIGLDVGVIDIQEVKSTVPRLTNHPALIRGGVSSRDLSYKISNSLTLEEIYETVDQQYHLTFEYLVLCASASIVCAVSLVSDNDPGVVASMLLSPLMGPILGMVLGTGYRDWMLMLKALRNELVGVGITLLFGVLTGLIVAPFKDANWETPEMLLRDDSGGLIPGVLIALPCGMALAVSVTSASITSLVGVAIAASLLPPIVTSGVELALGIWFHEHRHDVKATPHYSNSATSFVLFVLNLVSVYIGCLFIFVVKRVQPIKPRDISSMRRVLSEREGASEPLINFS